MKTFLKIILIILAVIILLSILVSYLIGNDLLPEGVKNWINEHPKLKKLFEAIARHSLWNRTWKNLKEDYEILTE